MAMSIFGNKKEEETDSGKAVEAKFTAIDDQFKNLGTKQEEIGNTLSSLADTIKQINERQAREDEARMERERKAKEVKPEARTAEQEIDAFAADPKKYIADVSSPAAKLAMITSARLMRNEVLGEKEYYYGDFKKKVDNLLENEPNLQNRNNIQFILNCYSLVLGENLEAIAKGELKKKTALMSGADGGSDGKRKDPNEKPSIEFRNDRGKNGKSVMDQMGLTEDDIIESAKHGYHGLEVVG